MPIILKLTVSTVGVCCNFCMSDGTVQINSVNETEQCFFRFLHSCFSVFPWLHLKVGYVMLEIQQNSASTLRARPKL